MRILVVNSFFPPRTTGSAHFSLDVAREYVRQGHEVWVATTSVPGAPEREELDGIHVVRLPAWSVTPGSLAFNYALPFVTRPGVIGRINRLFDEARPDVVHQNGQFFDLTFATTLVAWRRRVPRVLTVHTPLMHTNPVLRAFISMVDRTVLRLLNAPAGRSWSGSIATCARWPSVATDPAAGRCGSSRRRYASISSAPATANECAGSSISAIARSSCRSAMSSRFGAACR